MVLNKGLYNLQQNLIGRADLGGIFQNSNGHMLSAFVSNIEFASSVAAEILAFIEANRVAWVQDWKHIWVETNSFLVLHYLFKAPTSIP